MKRILLACFLLTATCSTTFIEHATAQGIVTPVTLADFTAKVNQLDSYIGTGDMTSAQTTWNQVHTMMLNILGVSKHSIQTATTPADKLAHVNILESQRNLYTIIWDLKNNLVTNRVMLHTKLGEFGATIY